MGKHEAEKLVKELTAPKAASDSPESPSLPGEALGKQPNASAERVVGAYVVMHGPGDLTEQPDTVAKALDEVIPKELKPLLHYVVLLSCMLAHKKKDKAGSTSWIAMT